MKKYIPLAILIFLSLAIKIPLFDRPIQHDEVYKTLVFLHDAPFSKNSFKGIQTDPSWKDDWRRQAALHPPLLATSYYYWVRVFGDSEISLRIPPILFSLAGVVFFYFSVTLIFDKFLAFWVILATILSVSRIGYATMSVHSIFESTMLSASLLCLAAILLKGKKKLLPVLYFLNILGILMFYHYLVYLVFQTIVLWLYRKKLVVAKYYFVGAGAVVIGALAFIYQSYIMGYLKYDFWMKDNAKTLFETMILLPFSFSVNNLGTSFMRQAILIFCFVPFVLFWLGGISVLKGFRKENAPKNLLQAMLLAIVVVPFICYWFAGFFVDKLGNERNFFYLLPRYYCFVFLGLRSVIASQKERIFVKWIFIGLLCAIALPSILIFDKYKWGEREMARLAAEAKVDFDVLVTGDSFIQAYYARQYGIEKKSFIFDSDNLGAEDLPQYLKQDLDMLPQAHSFAIVRKMHKAPVELKDVYVLGNRNFYLACVYSHQERRIPFELFDRLIRNKMDISVSIFEETKSAVPQ